MVRRLWGHWLTRIRRSTRMRTPIIPKPNGSSPSAQEVQDYMDGIAFNSLATFPSSYVYRGTDEEAAMFDDTGLTVHLGTSPRYHRK